jgi:hypothetical protein
MSGRYPFEHQNLSVLFDKIKRAEYSFEGEIWTEISDKAKDFI